MYYPCHLQPKKITPSKNVVGLAPPAPSPPLSLPHLSLTQIELFENAHQAEEFENAAFLFLRTENVLKNEAFQRQSQNDN